MAADPHGERLHAIADHRAKYDGSFLPTMFVMESLIARGAEEAELVAHPQLFATEGSYRGVLDGLNDACKQDNFTLMNMASGEQFKDRSSLRDRVLETFPPHPWLSTMLHDVLNVNTDVLDAHTTCHDQIQRLGECPGWDYKDARGTINTAFFDAIDAIFTMRYAGVKTGLLATCSAAEVQAAFAIFKKIVGRTFDGISDPNSKTGQPLPWHKHIPSKWGDSFPKLYQVPATLFVDDDLFRGIVAVKSAAVNTVVSAVRKRRRTSAQSKSGSSASGAAPSAAVPAPSAAPAAPSTPSNANAASCHRSVE